MEQKPPMPEEVHNEYSESEKMGPTEARQALEKEMRRLQSNELMRLATLEAENLQLTDRLDRCAEAYNGIAEQLRQERAHADALAGALGECRSALVSLDIDALGVVPEAHDCPAYPIRDALIDRINIVLNEHRQSREKGNE